MRQHPATYDKETDERVLAAVDRVMPRLIPAGWSRRSLGEDAQSFKAAWGLAVILGIEVVDGALWMHLSVSRADRIPSYDDLTEVKGIFIGTGRKAIMVLPAKSEHVNIHPNVLHLYSPLDEDPLPDFRFVDDSGNTGI